MWCGISDGWEYCIKYLLYPVCIQSNCVNVFVSAKDIMIWNYDCNIIIHNLVK